MMTTSGSEPRRVTLDDLAALNREVAAMVRSGLPLEAGLQQVASEFNRPTSTLAARLAEDMAAGQSLAEAVANRGDALPPVYRAVVDAGMRSGGLAAALEGFAETAARIASLRRSALQAIVYPLAVISLAWVLMLLIALNIIPEYGHLGDQHRFWISSLRLTSTATWVLAVSLPLLLVALAIAWWRASAAPLDGQRPGWLQRIPGGRRASRLSAQANFADLLHLLLASHVPLGEALPVAARGSGTAAFEAPALELSAQLDRGQPLSGQLPALHRLPPMVRTALMSAAGPGDMLAGLRRARDAYRERAISWTSDAGIIMPVAMMIAVGVGVVGLYALLILQPYYLTLHELASWNWR